MKKRKDTKDKKIKMAKSIANPPIKFHGNSRQLKLKDIKQKLLLNTKEEKLQVEIQNKQISSKTI